MSMEWVIAANAQSAGLLRPDLNIYIDIHPEVSMSRLTKAGTLSNCMKTWRISIAVRKKVFC